MKKYFSVIIIFLILLTSCQKDQRLGNYVGFTKADVLVDLTQQLPLLKLRIYTGLNISNVEVKKNSLIETTERVCYEILLNNQNKQYPGYLYEFNIRFKVDEFDIEVLDIMINNTPYNLKFGTYKTLILDQTSTTLFYQSHMEENKLVVELDNRSIHNYYLTSTKLIYHMTSHQLNLDKVFDIIYRADMKKIQIGTVKLEKNYHMVVGLYRANFITNLTEESLYIPYYYYAEPSLLDLKEKGIAINGLCTI